MAETDGSQMYLTYACLEKVLKRKLLIGSPDAEGGSDQDPSFPGGTPGSSGPAGSLPQSAMRAAS